MFQGFNINCSFAALSNLSITSYKEDTFGVVQKSLPTIISALLKLQEVQIATEIFRISLNIFLEWGVQTCD